LLPNYKSGGTETLDAGQQKEKGGFLHVFGGTSRNKKKKVCIFVVENKSFDNYAISEEHRK
jgi:hypothetical protein